MKYVVYVSLFVFEGHVLIAEMGLLAARGHG
jgi:hypothetical protein